MKQAAVQSKQGTGEINPKELLKAIKKLCPMKGSGIESVTIVYKGPGGDEALITLTEGASQKISNMLAGL
jgi:hypothetical protein